jgi:hypothetical protein
MNTADPDVAPDRSFCARLKERGFSVIILGLRVENRTVANPFDFFQEVIFRLRDILGKVALVVDGHDAISGGSDAGVYRSHAENTATSSILGVENQIVDGIREAFRNTEDLEIISTVGASMSRTLFWCSESKLFVTPWGAGLAKYRWVINSPGLVVAGRRFLQSAGEDTVHLYDSRKFMESPTPLTFFSIDDVEDDPDSPTVIALKDPRRTNFRVRRQSIQRRLLQALASGHQ